MSDLIDRQVAIDALCAVCGKACDKSEFVYNAPQDEQVILCPEHYCLCILPSAQPERLTDDDFETIRIHLNAYKEKLCNQHRWEEAEEYQRIINRFVVFVSAQSYALDEWCIDCKEYDHEKHCCPRWNRVIREALNDAAPMRKRGKWIQISPARIYECSVCGQNVMTGNIGAYSFCHGCGADLREGGEE